MTGCRRDRAFTLIELLVVVAIIALLISILLPSLGKAKENSRRSVCLSNLHHLGQTFQQYLHDYNDILPAAAMMPSLESVDPNADDYQPPIMTFLKPYAKNLELFRCPSDMPGKIQRDPSDPNKVGRSFWETEGTSYQYTEMPAFAADIAASYGAKGLVNIGDTMLKIEPQKPEELARSHPFHHSGRTNTSEMYLLMDYDPFHGKRADDFVFNRLYADLHVAEWLIRDPNTPRDPTDP
ncbi:MAG: prepilin-type N-terminal cleavage/methylation domain-containing protein [Phycisphaerae bacterium]|nr:prepilin-type N-terminal cleavage/methylation domain-containing protein [Phycisphaerae bacterium]